jgi:uncharacterized protein YjbJ (UPF0337 family)
MARELQEAPACSLGTSFTVTQGVRTMSGKSDEVKGRVKEAAGAITGDDKLRREGKIDQAAGKSKQAVEKIVDKVKDAAQRSNKQ